VLPVIAFDSGVRKRSMRYLLARRNHDPSADQQNLKMASDLLAARRATAPFGPRTRPRRNRNAWIDRDVKKDVGKFPNVNITTVRLRR